MQIDEQRARSVVRWFDEYVIEIDGPRVGQPFQLRDYQADPLRKLYGTLHQDARQYQTCLMVLGKKWGKTTIAAGLSLYHISLGAEYGAEVFSVANSRDQAAEVFRIAVGMIKLSCEEGLGRLRELFNYETDINETLKRIICRPQNAVYQAKAAEAGTLHGRKPSFLVVDELHAMRDRLLIDALREGMGTRSERLTLYITNMGELGGSPVFWEEYGYAKKVLADPELDPSLLPIINEAPADLTDDELLEEGPHWKQINPGLGDTMDVEDLRRAAREAKEKPSQRPNVLRLRFCRAVQAETAWLKIGEWDACKTDFSIEDLIGRTCYLGVDLSSKIDMTAAVFVFPEPDGGLTWYPLFWLPADNIRQLEHQCEVPLQSWAADPANNLKLTEGNVVDYEIVERDIFHHLDLFDCREAALDEWNAEHTGQAIAKRLHGNTVYIQQVWKHLNEPSKHAETLIKSGKLRHDGNKVLRWQAEHVTVKVDDNDNIRPSKPDRRKAKWRIDGIAAGVNGTSRALRHQDNTSVYESRGIRAL